MISEILETQKVVIATMFLKAYVRVPVSGLLYLYLYHVPFVSIKNDLVFSVNAS